MTVLRNSNVRLYSNQGDDYLCMAGVDDFITGIDIMLMLLVSYHLALKWRKFFHPFTIT